MANIIFRDGFDIYNGIGTAGGLETRWTGASAGGRYCGMVAGRFGGQALYIGTTDPFNSTTEYRAFDSATTDFTLGFALKIPILDNAVFVWLMDGASPQLTMRVDTLGAVYIAAAADRAVSASGVIIPDEWASIEISGKIDAAIGEITVKVNGAVVASATGVNTKVTGSSSINGIKLGCIGVGLPEKQKIFDDMYVVDSLVSLGPCRIVTSGATSNGSHQDFTPSTGASNSATVDELPVSAVDYVSGSTVGQYDEYGITPIATNPFQIYEVNMVVAALKTDAGTRALELGVDSGGVVAVSPDKYLTNTLTFVSSPFTLDPNTGESWTKAGLNGVTLRPKVSV